MNIIEGLLLGVLQGFTEFLPVSSSGHLALFQNIFSNIDISFDIMVHLATLLAVLIFFFGDIMIIIRDVLMWDKKSENFWMFWYLIIATIPAGLAGFFLRNVVQSIFSNLLFVGFGFIISGLFLFSASFVKHRNNLNIKNSLIVGIAQALAILPGLSRSGSTVSTGVLLGVEREKAIKFSFLMSIPVIIGASILEIGKISFSWPFFAGFAAAFISGFIGIFIFVKHIRIKNFRWFAYYCWLLAIVCFLLTFLG